MNANRGMEPVPSATVHRLSHLKGVLATEAFHLVEMYSGVTEPQFRTFTGESTRRIDATLAQLMAGDLLVRRPVYRLPDGSLTSDVTRFGDDEVPAVLFQMHYLSDKGCIIVEHGDISSLSRIRRRVHEDIRKDHADERPQILHTLGLNDSLAALTARGYQVSDGYRGALYLPGGRQLAPDARMSAALDLSEYATEYIRGNSEVAMVRAGVTLQLVKYVTNPGRFPAGPVMCVCENEGLLNMVAELGQVIHPRVSDRSTGSPSPQGPGCLWPGPEGLARGLGAVPHQTPALRGI